MSKPVVSIENLSKAYRLGESDTRKRNFQESLFDMARAPFRRLRRMRSEQWSGGNDTHWALRDVHMQVNRGEVMGVIGRNGAGKSTLLKVLSRITEPTSGRVRLRGRVSALLEVGTGFHPELTGRENIFLNGAILGMRRAEIKARFDEIVDFAEVEKFLDTPVKRYSSGMYVRLAFAVAAHLEPEVLIVDEVLAVGDMAFQKKCLGRIRQVASGEGRTVLFVSHNMDAVLNLCTHTVLMEGGTASERLTPMEGVRRYLVGGADENVPLIERPRIQHAPRPNAFSRLTIRRADGVEDNVIPAGEGASFEVEILHLDDTPGVLCGIAITDDRGQRVTTLASHFNSNLTFGSVPSVRLRCDVPSLPLTPGTYFIDLILSNDQHTLERVERAGKIEIVYADYLGTGKLPTYKQGHVITPAAWKLI